jgi:hypothetical protein
MLPEGRGFTFIEFVEPTDDANDTTRFIDRNARVYRSVDSFSQYVVIAAGMPTDPDSLVRVAGHANNVQHGALRLRTQPPRRVQMVNVARQRETSDGRDSNL